MALTTRIARRKRFSLVVQERGVTYFGMFACIEGGLAKFILNGAGKTLRIPRLLSGILKIPKNTDNRNSFLSIQGSWPVVINRPLNRPDPNNNAKELLTPISD